MSQLLVNATYERLLDGAFKATQGLRRPNTYVAVTR